MDENQKQYEISFLLKNDSGRESLLNVLNKHGVSIANQLESRRIRLTYPIKKEDFGSMGCVFFGGKPEDIRAISQDLEISSDILRFMISVSPGAAAGPQPKRSRVIAGRIQGLRPKLKNESSAEIKAALIPPKKEDGRAPKPIFKGELSNEELEKKLEEILK